MSLEPFLAALTDPQMPVPPGVTCARGQRDAKRFAVYRNNVHVSLVEALRKGFPVTSRVVGDPFFAAMARVYVGDHKPKSPLMFTYGDNLPEFISGFPPATPLPYLADLARLEYAWTQCYHAADAPPLALDRLSAIAPHDFHDILLKPHPATRLLRSDHPVGSIWMAHQVTQVGKVPMTGHEVVLITRPHAQVRVTIVPATDHDFLSALLAGASLGETSARALSENPGFDVGTALAGLTNIGTFSALQHQDQHQ